MNVLAQSMYTEWLSPEQLDHVCWRKRSDLSSVCSKQVKSRCNPGDDFVSDFDVFLGQRDP